MDPYETRYRRTVHCNDNCPGCPGSSAPGQQISANNQGAKTEANGLSRNCLYIPPCIIASHLLLPHVGYVLGGQGGGSGAGGLDTVTAWGGRQLQYWTLVV